jgi:hypothetical protein
MTQNSYILAKRQNVEILLITWKIVMTWKSYVVAEICNMTQLLCTIAESHEVT